MLLSGFIIIDTSQQPISLIALQRPSVALFMYLTDSSIRVLIPLQLYQDGRPVGMVRQWQTLFYGQRYSATVLNDKVDFVKVAEAMGATGIRVSSLEELDDAIKKAIELNGPVVLDCQIQADDKVWPMVAPGTSISEAFSEEDLNMVK